MTDSTRQRILDTAERLFADQGFHATTLRQITSEAGVNLAAVNYHHGSKDALILAVFQRRLDDLNSERLARLDRAVAAADPPELEGVLEAFIYPALLLSSNSAGDGGRFMRLLMRAWSENASQLHGKIDWSATDVNGNPIDFNPDGTVAPVGPGFDGPGLEFGPGNGTDLSLAGRPGPR